MARWYAWLAAIALFTSIAGQSQAKLEWTDPGRAPYIGSAENALEIFAREVLIPGTYERIPRQILDRQFEMWHSGQCTWREIQSNEYFGYMLFKRGLMARDIHAHTEAWRNGLPLGIMECIVVDHQHHLVFKLQRPDVCHNWTYTIAPLLPPLGREGLSELPPNVALPTSGGGFGFPGGGGGSSPFVPLGGGGFGSPAGGGGSSPFVPLETPAEISSVTGLPVSEQPPANAALPIGGAALPIGGGESGFPGGGVSSSPSVPLETPAETLPPEVLPPSVIGPEIPEQPPNGFEQPPITVPEPPGILIAFTALALLTALKAWQLYRTC